MTTQKEALDALDTLPASPKGLYEEYHSRLDIIRSYIEQSAPAKIREETLDECVGEISTMLAQRRRSSEPWTHNVNDCLVTLRRRIRSLRDQDADR